MTDDYPMLDTTMLDGLNNKSSSSNIIITKALFF